MPEAFPRLTQSSYRSTSPSDVRYNCVAWAAEDSQHWWQPGFYWPVPDDVAGGLSAKSSSTCGALGPTQNEQTPGPHD